MKGVIQMPERLYCAFCGRDRSSVEWLVQSPLGPCICEECASMAVELISNREIDGDRSGKE